MRCKNCNHILTEDALFCSHCGAKVIKNRLTARTLWAEAQEKLLSFESNKPIRTFVDLFADPKQVIDGYIKGVRKRYINAFGYFTIAVTFSSLFYFIAAKFFPETLNSGYELFSFNQEQTQFGDDIKNATFEYQSLIFFLFIPFFALISWILFLDKRKYNYVEHLIINLYGYSQASITAILLYFVTIWFDSIFKYTLLFTLFLQMIYYAYMLAKVYELNLLQIGIKTILFIPLGFIFYIVISIGVFIILILFGAIDIKDFVPQPETTALFEKHYLGSYFV